MDVVKRSWRSTWLAAPPEVIGRRVVEWLSLYWWEVCGPFHTGPSSVSVETGPVGARLRSACSICGKEDTSLHAPVLDAELRERHTGAYRTESSNRSPAPGGVHRSRQT